MDFLKKLLGGSGGSSHEDRGLYVYIKIRRSGEIVRLRVSKESELSQADDGRLFVRKQVMGTQSFERVDVTLYFDESYRLKDAEMVGGELSTKEAYLAQQDSLEG